MRTAGILGLIAVSLALAAPAGAIKARINASDEARAKSSVLRISDLPSSSLWKGGRTTAKAPPDRCKGYSPKDSDLVVTGQAESTFTMPGAMVQSDVSLLASPRMANLNWTRTFGPGFVRCITTLLVDGFTRDSASVRILSAGTVPVQRLSTRTTEYRLLYEATVHGTGIPGVTDLVALQGGRTIVTLLVTSVLPSTSADESGVDGVVDDLAQVLAQRVFAQTA
jgi:hypothetical protein